MTFDDCIGMAALLLAGALIVWAMISLGGGGDDDFRAGGSAV